ncbi:tetratricopeptide repeat protein [Nonomuraea deserti]|uniref:Tetratricopeptide repeat protein n=1 Tax=Nonomuraea deserti TaxID=1848322 RepID=A0A4R4UMF4_9ACTN|nr:LuxR C-terminal-related transcriptional regulator [Nonomuraea deserti]TDC90304.1 tetratricopeptide repeat protein [Nonomuraea deserti]
MLRFADFTNLPAESNTFVGRESDVDELVQLMRVSRVVTLCGAGGIGKTRLALRLAARVTPVHAGGVWLVELADLGEGEVRAHVAASLGVAGDPGALIGGRRVLLLLDNCEPVIGECAELCRDLLGSCPGLTILATSREPLRVPGETVWRVPPLSIDGEGGEAVRLFAARAAAARPGFELTADTLPQVATLCRALDGLPLAIELAAAMVRVLSVRQLVERLDDRFRLLAGGPRTAPARHRTLRAAVDWSYRLLSPQERVLLRRTTVFRAGWTLDLAERVCAGPGLPEEEVLPRLCDLVDKSLVALDGEIAGQARYRLLETVREYALEQLAESGEEPELRHRHLTALAGMAAGFRRVVAPERRMSWPVVERYINLFDGLKAEVAAACDWSISTEAPETALTMLTDVRFLLTGCGRKLDVAERLDRLLALDAPRVPPALRGQATILRGELALAAGDREPARRWVRAGLAACATAHDTYGVATGLIVLAWLTGDQDMPARALEAAKQSGDRVLESLAHSVRAAAALRQGRLREARRAYGEVLAINEELDNHVGRSSGHIGLAQVARDAGDLAAAKRHYESALSLIGDVDARQQKVSGLAGLGGVALDQGDLATARAMLTEALVLSRDAGLCCGIARRLEGWARLATAEGDHRLGVLMIAASVALRGRQPDARTENVLRPARALLGDEMVAVLWAEGAKMTADQAVSCALDGTRPDPSAAVFVPVVQESRLTTREREIAELVARGLSNRAIADELVISPATAARHVANILSKLGFSTRTQIAAWMIGSR